MLQLVGYRTQSIDCCLESKANLDAECNCAVRCVRQAEF